LTFYNSHGYMMNLSEVIALEVEDRGNFTLRQVKAWIRKYGLTVKSRLIWVSRNRELVKDWYMDDPEAEPIEIPETKGKIIKESDDGNEGYLLVVSS